MISISASLIKDYLICKRRVYYRINAPEESISTKEMSLGTIVHSAIEVGWKNKDEAYASVPGFIKQHNFKTDDTKIYSCIDNFFNLFPENFFSPEDTSEKYFKIPYKDDIMFSGRMDRIHDDVVYDWKTNSWPPKDINFDAQFIFYYICYEMLYGRTPKSLAFVALALGKVYYFTPIPMVIENFKENIIPAVVKDIKDHNLPTNGYPKQCKYCSFNNICFKDLGLE